MFHRMFVLLIVATVASAQSKLKFRVKVSPNPNPAPGLGDIEMKYIQRGKTSMITVKNDDGELMKIEILHEEGYNLEKPELENFCYVKSLDEDDVDLAGCVQMKPLTASQVSRTDAKRCGAKPMYSLIKCQEEDFEGGLPIVLATWPYREAVQAGWTTITTPNKTAIDAVEAAGRSCEETQCLLSVGFGGSPDENGETTLDAMIMDGVTHKVGAVGGLRRINNAISVARKVLDNTEHTFIVGDLATQFALANGFKEENLTTEYSRDQWRAWRKNNCQPNFRKNVRPDPKASCGPYQAINAPASRVGRSTPIVDKDNHDTIGVVAIDSMGRIASGGSTNGLQHKVAGRVGDTPIAGAGTYADAEIGAACCTGNGDIMMRFLPSYQTVSLMATGMSPRDAALTAIKTIRQKYPNFTGGVVATNKYGQIGAACHIWTDFQIAYRYGSLQDVVVKNITCLQKDD